MNESAAPAAQFATGHADEIARLTSAFSIHVERGGAFVEHTLATAVIGRDGRIEEIWRGNAWSATELSRMLLIMLRE
jgi:protein SCO1/2